jgi:probable F420-dependent oxidoreductase
MTIGIAMYGSRPDQQPHIARRADELGFDGLWFGEHIALPEAMGAEHPYSTGRSTPAVVSADPRMYDIWTMIGAVICATKRVTVATGIYLLTLRHPLISARAAITAQELAGGRFRFGVGAGWLASEFDAMGVSFADRAKRFDEILDLMPRFFAGESVEHHSEHFDFNRVAFVREPIRVPIIMGGASKPALRRAALKGDGWVGSTFPLEENIRIKEELEQYRREFGREHLPFERHHRIVETPIAKGIEKFRAAGLENLVITFDQIHPPTIKDRSTEAILKSLERVANEIGVKPPAG